MGGMLKKPFGQFDFNLNNEALITDGPTNLLFVRYSSEHKNLSLVARDVKPLEVYSAEFLVDNSSLAFLVSDSLQNLVIYMYQPEAKESAGGQRLVRKADINLGSHVTAFWRIRLEGKFPLCRYRVWWARADLVVNISISI